MEAPSLTRQSAAVPERSEAPSPEAKAEGAAEGVTTPKGTLLILIAYAGVIAALWGYMYVSMLMRR